MSRFFLGVSVSLALCACPKRAETNQQPRAVRLLTETAEREHAQLKESRTDLEIDTRDFERTPKVVATGETPLLTADGADARLYGDEAGTKGFSVDNCVLIEVLGVDGRVLNRAVVGFVEGVLQGNERLDNLGRQAFAFEAGEVNLSSMLPERGTFKLRATVLDYGGVGRVSDVFVRLIAKDRPADDLRGQ